MSAYNLHLKLNNKLYSENIHNNKLIFKKNGKLFQFTSSSPESTGIR